MLSRNTWNYFACDDQCKNGDPECISEDLIKQIADAMVDSGMASVGYEYVNLVIQLYSIARILVF